MTFQPADGNSLSLFIVFAIAQLVVIVFAFLKAEVPKKFMLALALYLVLFTAAVGSGAVLEHVIPLAPILFFSVVLGSILLGLSEAGQRVGLKWSLAVLLGYQGFRFFLELILHHWASLGTIPQKMTWTGQNWDIVAGILCLIATPFVNRSKSLAWGVQVIGVLLLLNVLRVVILSSPFPFSWALENPLQLIFHLPYALIAPRLVGPANFAHVVVFRKLTA